MAINPSFLKKSPLHAKLGELIEVGHKMAKADGADRAAHKLQLHAKLHELGAHLKAQPGARQETALKGLLADATHDKVHRR